MPLIIQTELKLRKKTDMVGYCVLRNVVDMYSNTAYVAKTSNNAIGKDIIMKHGLTQRNTSSASIFSYFISHMYEAINTIHPKDIFDQLNIFQVSDDSMALADDRDSLIRKAKTVFHYSDWKCVVVNVPRTKFMEFSNYPGTEL